MKSPSGDPPQPLPARLHNLIWARRDSTLPTWKSGSLRMVRTLSMLVRDLVGGQLTLRAMSLVYTTLLSIVPLLALSFSVLKGFGVSNQIRPVLLQVLEPLGEKGVEVANQIVGFIENMNVGVLGALGLGLLLYTAISLMQKIEESLNFIWHIPQPRRLGERFSRYLSVLLVGPILVFSALGITATVMNIDTVRGLLEVDVFGQAVQALGRLMPYLLVICAFTFVYIFIPNTRVRLGPALLGGAIGGIAWQTAGWAFALFVASSNTYAAIYSGFAILVLFMIWLYVSWLVLLFGASLAFYAQHPEYLYAGGGEPRLSNRVRERLGLSVMSLTAGHFLAGSRAPSLNDFTRAFGVPSHSMMTVVSALVERQLLVPSDEDPVCYLPGRDLSTISVAAILDALRAAGEDSYLTPTQLPAPAPVEDVVQRIESTLADELADMNLRDLAAMAPVAAGPAGRRAVAATSTEPFLSSESTLYTEPDSRPGS